MEKYEYRPLDAPRGSIRLVHILPSQTTGQGVIPDPQRRLHASISLAPIRCTISHETLGDCPPYECLSYNWGNADDICLIELNGKSMRVTRNLERALRELQRTTFQPRAFWVDALCINQDDNVEKSYQVRMMGSTFSKALTVAIWLGPGDEDSIIALNAIRRLSNPKLWRVYRAYMRAVKKAKQNAVEHPHTQEDTLNRVEGEDELLTKIESTFESDGRGASLKAIQKLINNSPWFERVWVLPEVAVCKDAIVMCGPEVIRWREIDRAHQLLYLLRRRRLDHQDIEVLKYIENRLWLFCTVWFDLNHYQQKRSLDYLLRNISRMKATDPRDLVYALIDLASDTEQLGIEVDYSKSIEEVYVETATALIKQRGLEMLSQRLSTQASRRLPLPTWVPDWSLPIQIGWRLRNLGGTQRLPVPMSISDTTFSSKVLSLSGSVLDTLTQVGEILPGDINQNPSPEEKLAIVSSWLKDFVAIHSTRHEIESPYDTPNDLADALWLTPIGGCNYGYDWNYKPPQEADSHDYLLLSGQRNTSRDCDGPISGVVSLNSMYLHSIVSIARGRRMFITSRGHIGLGPPNASSGDVVSIFQADNVPFILRPEANSRFYLIGEAYVHGMHNIDDTSRDITQIIEII